MSLQRRKLYPVMDRLEYEDRQRLGLKLGESKGPLTSLGVPASGVHARWTGEKRAPRRGEWYLSGADIGAYRAPNDLSTAYHIAELVRTKTETVTRTIIIPSHAT